MAKLYKLMEVSDVHVAGIDLTQVTGLSADPVQYGWLIYVSPDEPLDYEEAAMPEAVRVILAHARRHGCQYVLIDKELAEEDPELPLP
jgi:hypothetical protein